MSGAQDDRARLKRDIARSVALANLESVRAAVEAEREMRGFDGPPVSAPSRRPWRRCRRRDDLYEHRMVDALKRIDAVRTFIEEDV